MSHNLNQRNGNYSFFSVRELPWHGLGKILEFAPTAADAIKIAQMDFTVDATPLFARINDREKILKDKKCTYRTDTEDVLGIVSKRYEIVQNVEAFDFFDYAVGEGQAIYETAGVLGKGEVIFITAKMPDTIRIGKSDDIIDKYLLLTMGHDGSLAIHAMFTPVRVVCNNTLLAALADKRNEGRITIKHTKKAHEKMLIARELMNITNKTANTFAEMLNQMVEIKLTEEQLVSGLELVLLTKKELQRLALVGDATDKYREAEVPTAKIKTLDEMVKYSFEGPGQELDTCKGTAFGLYNAVSGYYQNWQNFRTEENRMFNNLLGGNATTIKKSFNVASLLTQ